MLRLEGVTRDFVEAGCIRDEFPDLVEHGLGKRVPFDIDVDRHIAATYRQVELPIAVGDFRKIDRADDGDFEGWHDYFVELPAVISAAHSRANCTASLTACLASRPQSE